MFNSYVTNSQRVPFMGIYLPSFFAAFLIAMVENQRILALTKRCGLDVPAV
jgi:hypothetical protein